MVAPVVRGPFRHRNFEFLLSVRRKQLRLPVGPTGLQSPLP